MNKMIQVFIDNEKLFYNAAFKYIRNEQVARDMIQRTYVYLLEFPKEPGVNPISYIHSTIKGRYLNEIREWKYKKTTFEELPVNLQSDFHETMDSSLDHKLALEKVLDIVDSICSNKEREAVYHILATDDPTKGINGKSFETLKANRKWAIKRVKRYLDEVHSRS